MLMRKNLIVTLLGGLLCFSLPAFAEVNVNIEGLTEAQKAQLVLQAEQMKKEAQKPQQSFGEKITEVANPQKVSEWVDLGKNMGLAIAAVAKELGVATDEFLKSNTGKIAITLIAWKVIGKDVLHIVGGTTAWFVLASIIVWSFRFFHMTKKEKGKDGAIEYVNRFEFRESDAKTASAVVHVLCFLAITLGCMKIIFG